MFPDGVRLAIIGQPWQRNPYGYPGGTPFHSCVADGRYELIPWKRPNGDEVYIMYNPHLGVFKLPSDHEPGQARNLCLLHRANFATQVKGCWAIGTRRALLRNRKTGKIERAVASSRTGMDLLRDKLGRHDSHTLVIRTVLGTTDRYLG